MVTVETVTIHERAEGWGIQWDLASTDEEPIPTAAEALKAVRARAQQSGHICLTIVTWEPTTRIGRMVVNALQES